MLIHRDAETTLRQAAREYPVVAVTGLRQSGKTTVVREVFANKPYVSLEDLDELEAANTDPRGFLARFPGGAVFDEAQRCPRIFSYLQTRVDETRKKGQFILTGSQQFGLTSQITQSLAGRVALVPLLPFTLNEVRSADVALRDLVDLLFQGLYPPIYDTRPDISNWYGNYIRT
ncbi:MAG: ATP-binding protein, partial [Gammaproteobacteria bacterium]